MAKVLIVDDNANIRNLMAIYMRNAGLTVEHATNGNEALDMLYKQHFDLVVLDIMMPELDGYGMVASLRAAKSTVPVLMVTAKNTWPDKKQGFEYGADDYMVKPVDMDELVVRSLALLRRARITSSGQLQVGELLLDSESLEVRGNGFMCDLPRREFQVLFKLLSHSGKIFTRQELLDEFWGLDSDVDERTVDVHVKRLRDKLAERTEFEIVTVRGLGYKAVRHA